MTRLSEMTLVPKETKYKHGEHGLFVYVHQRAGDHATVWVEDMSGTAIDNSVALQYVKLLAPDARVERRGSTFEVTPASALFEEVPCSSSHE